MNGQRVGYRLDDGSVEEIRGLVEGETDQVLRLRRNGDVQELPKERIVYVEPEPIDARAVWTSEQLVERYLGSMKEKGIDVTKLSTRDHWALATYAEWAGALQVAREHYAACAADPEYLQKDVAGQRLARVESLIQDSAALQTLKDARMKLPDALLQAHAGGPRRVPREAPAGEPGGTQQVDRLRAELGRARTAYFQDLARRNFLDVVQDLIDDKVREKDVQITDVTSWTRRELPDKAFAKLADKWMKKYDDVTPEEARTSWEGRMEGRSSRPGSG